MFPPGGTGGGGRGAFGVGNAAGSSTSFNNATPHAVNGAPNGLVTATRGRGRGRGATHGAPRGAGAFGVQRHTNLSWRKPDDAAAAAAEGAAAGAGAETEASTGAFGSSGSTFTAFGAAANAGFGSSSGANQGASPFSSSAFGAPSSAFAPTAGFGLGTPATSNAFATSTSSAFPSTSSLPSSESAFASSSFGTAPAAQSMPLFRVPSQQSEGDEAPLGGDPAPKKRNPAQISTLEVLGEDSDARKKRFEATLPNNRYLELKPRREAQRLAAIKAGTIPDPSKPMRLDQATDFEGTCQDMCPEWEREEREYQNNVDPLERYPGTTRIDPARAVKAFHRPAAGNDQPLPSDVRPAPVLQRTLDYLFHTLLPTQPLAATHPFLRDRTRSIRQDFTVQNVRDVNAVRCNERIARYHILAVGVLREESGFSEQQELEQLRKVLKSLNEFYDDLRLSGSPDPTGNEAEFRAYNLLTHLRDPDIVWSVELLPPEIFMHPLLQRALALHRLAQRSNIPRGERASQNAFSRFFKLVSEPGTPYLFACILSTHFNDIRRSAIDALRSAYLKQHSAFPVRTLAKILGCDDEADARSVCEQLGIVVRTDERGRVVAEVHKQAALKAGGLRPKVARRLVEGKRGQTPYPAIIDGSSGKPFDVAAIPSTPSTATHPSFAPSVTGSTAPQVLPAASQAAPSFPKTVPFGTSQISTPVVTPPRAATPAPDRPAATNGLDAGAPAFVPSFSRPQPHLQSQPQAPAPVQPAPSTNTSAFTPTAPAFVPAPGSTFGTAAFYGFKAATAAPPGVPPTSGFSSVQADSAASLPSPKPPPSVVPARPVQVTPIKISEKSASPSSVSPSTLRRVSVTRASPVRPSAAALAAAARRTQLVDDLVQHFTAEIVSAAAEGAIHRAAASALKDRWTAIRAQEERTKQVFAAAVASSAVAELARLASREAVYRAWRDVRGQRTAWNDWQQAVRRSVERKEREAEARQEWREVVGAIEAKSAHTQDVRTSANLTGRGDEVMSDDGNEDDEDGLAGDLDAGIVFDDLSLGTDIPDLVPDRKVDRVDRTLAGRIESAAQERDRIWAAGTFLNIVVDLASKAIAKSPFDKRPYWSTLIVTPSTSSPLAAWLACKFDLDPSELSVEVDTPEFDLGVEMVPLDASLDDDIFDHVGLILLDCTDMPVVPAAVRERFANFFERARRQSLFAPSLLILQAPSSTRSDADQPPAPERVATMLGLSELPGIAQIAIYRPAVKDAESAFSVELAKLLDDVHVIPGRVERSLRGYVNTAARAWRASFARQNRVSSALSRPEAVGQCLRVLQDFHSDVESVAIPRVKRPLSLPEFDGPSRPFEAVVQSYVQNPLFETAGHFPALSTLLAARPPLPNHVIGRSLVDHVAEFLFANLSERQTRQQALDERLPRAYDRFQDSLTKLEEDLEALSATATASQAGPTKKRRASAISPADSLVSSPKKQANGVNGVNLPDKATTKARPPDRLLALEDLMRDARSLLAKT
ncbi:hypothetical protein JCM3774_002422 [Rhodotorula dairenensis]